MESKRIRLKDINMPLNCTEAEPGIFFTFDETLTN